MQVGHSKGPEHADRIQGQNQDLETGLMAKSQNILCPQPNPWLLEVSGPSSVNIEADLNHFKGLPAMWGKILHNTCYLVYSRESLQAGVMLPSGGL